MNKWQNSECRNHYLHAYKIIKQEHGKTLERCRRCGDKQIFPDSTPNHRYLSFHLRQALQVDDPRFLREYPNFK